jgi:hypothetical protein
MKLLSATLFAALAAQTAFAAFGDLYVPGRLSVRFADHPQIERGADSFELADPALNAICQANDAREIAPLYENLRTQTTPDLSLNYLLEFDRELDMEVVAAAFEATGLVEYAEPDYMMPISRVPNDPMIGQQWFLDAVDAYDAWDLIPEDPSNPDMIVAVIDSGVDWNHPDLRDIIWVNPGEDLDGDGYVPTTDTIGDPDDRNELDDDANGKIDDFYGWDWVSTSGCHPEEDCTTPDNDPMDFNGHGTHCSGIAAGNTNNALGIASVAWDARVMCLRAGYSSPDGNGYVIQSAASNAIYYAIENGASIISMSFGGSSTLRTPASVAYNSGLLCFHAAGNDNVTTQDQLDRASGMVSVASSAQGDCKSDFSNYGEWIDILAPGSAIMSTNFNNTYASFYGTSMACPLAASVAALVWWNHPELTASELRARMLGTVDDIYGLYCNDDYIGLLGSGRVNAYKAMMNIRDTQLVLDETRIEDASGDGRFMPGEELLLSVSFSNTGINPSETVTLTITCEDEGVEILNPTVEWPPLPDGFSYDNFSEPAHLLITAGTEARYFDLSFEITTANASTLVGEGDVVCGDPTVLLYDDGETETVGDYYYAFLKEQGIIFDHFSSSLGVFPAMPTLELDTNLYAWAIYASGQATITLDLDEQALMTDYVDAGHDLLFVSQHANTDLAGSVFLSDFLRAETGEMTTATRGARGIPGNTATEGQWLILQGAGGAGNQDAPIDEILPLVTGAELYYDNNEAFVIGVHNGWVANRVAYLNFALEAAGGIGSSQSCAEAMTQILENYLLDESDLDEGVNQPLSHRLNAVWPNPFNPATRVSFELGHAGWVELSVFNVLGQEVAQIASDLLPAGAHERQFDAAALPSGLYLAHLVVDGQSVATQKMLLVR